MAKEIGVKMLNIYLNLIDEEVRGMCEQASEADKKMLATTKLSLATKHGVADKLRRITTLEVMIKEAEAEIASTKQVISNKFHKFIDEDKYCYGWDTGLEQLAKKSMVSKVDVLHEKIQNVKKQLKLAGCSGDVKNIFANLKTLLS